jgi:hypothetical protein
MRAIRALLTLMVMALAAAMAFCAVHGWWAPAGMLGALLLAAALVLWWVKRKVVNWAQKMSAGSVPPERITLTPVAQVEWSDPERARTRAAELGRLGFKPIGLFLIPEMPEIKLLALHNSFERLYGIVYEHPRVGVWIDLAGRYEDGGSLTVTDSSRAGVLDKPEGHVSIAMPGEPTARLFERLRAERLPKQMLPTSPAEFVARFTGAYADEMAWRKQRGGATEDEIKRVADNVGIDASPEAVAMTREIEKLRAKQP